MCSTTKTRVKVAKETCRANRVAAEGRRRARDHGWDKIRPVETSATRSTYDATPLARPSNQLTDCGPCTASSTSQATRARIDQGGHRSATHAPPAQTGGRRRAARVGHVQHQDEGHPDRPGPR